MEEYPQTNRTGDPPPPSFGEAVRFWFRLGWISFGGPAGQIAIMHRELVETRRWVEERHFLNGLNYCMLLPGPEAQQLAVYLGWRLHGTKGGIVAGTLFVIPSMLILFALSWLYMAGGNIGGFDGLLRGLFAAVIAVVIDAVLRIGGRALKSPALWGVAGLAFLAIFLFKVSFTWIVPCAALLGWLGHGISSRQFPSTGRSHSGKPADSVAAPPVARARPRAWTGPLLTTLVILVLWWLPVFGLAAWLGWQSAPAQQGLFFSKAALVTFGGAYAVLPYVAQQAVEHHGWLSYSQMMAGLALAETTPGPLIMVLQFVGFGGAWQNPGGLEPLTAAIIGSLITTWVTFLPGFLFIFLGAPHIERMSNIPRLSAALTAITAAVVGVILNLAVQFASHALWPGPAGLDWLVAILAIAALVALKWLKTGLIPVILGCGLTAWLLHGLAAW